MKNFRTKKSNRTTYIYRDEHGKAVTVLRPGENGVIKAEIGLLHRMDDDEHNTAKKDSYYGTLHYDQILDDDGLPDNPQKDLADESANPETMLFAALEAAERSGEFKAIWDKLQPQQRDLVMKKQHGATNREIAAEDGVSEVAINYRLATIQKKFERFLK